MTYQHTNKQKSINIAHINVNHLINKIQDLNVFFHQTNIFHLFGISESRLKENIGNDLLSIPNYTIHRRDAASPGHTGLAVYVHNSIAKHVKRRKDLESKHIEILWLEIKDNKSSPTLVGYVYRNPAAPSMWYSDFTQMMDNINFENIILLGDLNINLFKPNLEWECITSSLGFTQVIRTATRVAKQTSTLIDHIYTKKASLIKKTWVPNIGISDHFPICCTINTKLTKERTNAGHSYVTYRCFKKFDEMAFLNELSTAPFHLVRNFNDPNQALCEWYKIFYAILDKHAPLKQKRVKKHRLPKWITPQIQLAMKRRDELKAARKFDLYKRQRNIVKNLVIKAKKKFFNDMISENSDISSLWRAINILSGRSTSKEMNTNISLDEFNNHFLSVADNINKSLSTKPEDYYPSEKLKRFCKIRTDSKQAFTIPLMTSEDTEKSISSLKTKKTLGSDNISTSLLKLSKPYIAESLTFIYNLCIKENCFPDILKLAKVIPVPKSGDPNDPNNYRPISILPTISKPLEKYIQNQLMSYCEKHNLIYQ